MLTRRAVREGVVPSRVRGAAGAADEAGEVVVPGLQEEAGEGVRELARCVGLLACLLAEGVVC